MIQGNKLEVGEVVKNYKELCKKLEIPIGSGTQKKAQLKEIDRYIKYEKSGQKFIILEIYDEPLLKIDRRKDGNKNVYLKYIQTILMQYVCHTKGHVCYITKKNLWKMLGMINKNYKNIPLKELQTQEIEYLDVSEFEFNKFYARCDQKLNDILFTALKNLRNRCLMSYEIETMIIEKDLKQPHRVAKDFEIADILEVEKNVLNSMGCYSINHAACTMRLGEFYKKVNKDLFDLYGWRGKYERIKLIFNKEHILEEIPRDVYELQMMYLNELVVNAVDKNAQTVYDNRQKRAYQEYKEYLKSNPPVEYLSEAGIYTYPKYFVDIQKLLSQKFLAIEKKDIGTEEIDKLLEKTE